MTSIVTELSGQQLSQGAGTGSTTLSLGTLTAGRGLLFCVSANQGGSFAITSCAITGETVVALGSLTAGNPCMQWFKVQSIQSGGAKSVQVNYTGGANGTDIGVAGVEVTGFDTGNMVPTVGSEDTNNPAHIAITTGFANSAVVALVKGGFNDGGTASGYSMFICAGANNRTRMFYSNNVGAAGSKDTAVSDGWQALAIEVKNFVASGLPARFGPDPWQILNNQR